MSTIGQNARSDVCVSRW